MITLISVELKKILHKKSIYVIWSLMLIFCSLNNFLYKIDYDENGNYKYKEQENLELEKQKLEKEIKEYNQRNLNDFTMYITLKTKLDIIGIKKEFPTTSWQYKKTNIYLYDIIYNLNKYSNEKETAEYQNTNQEYQDILQKLYDDDWQYFIKIEKNKLEDSIAKLQEEIEQTKDKKERIDLEEQLSSQKFDLSILNYRIKKQIKEDDNYLNIALENYRTNYKIVKNYQTNSLKRNHQEELKYREALSNMKENQYIIEYENNINKQNNLNYQLRTIVEDYEIFLVILLLIISGIIICDEFKDGTIKLLLIKPYSRGKILLSKYFTITTVMGLSILGLIIFQILIGGIMFGFESLKTPVVVYHFDVSKLIEYSVFKYMSIRILTRIPFFLILIHIALFIGVISNSNILAITIPLMLYMFKPTLEILAIQYNLTFMKYLINLNWDLQNYLFGNISNISIINLSGSIVILIIHFIVLSILTFKIFKKKNIKNI